jgi:hypothetical protein
MYAYIYAIYTYIFLVDIIYIYTCIYNTHVYTHTYLFTVHTQTYMQIPHLCLHNAHTNTYADTLLTKRTHSHELHMDGSITDSMTSSTTLVTCMPTSLHHSNSEATQWSCICNLCALLFFLLHTITYTSENGNRKSRNPLGLLRILIPCKDDKTKQPFSLRNGHSISTRQKRESKARNHMPCSQRIIFYVRLIE